MAMGHGRTDGLCLGYVGIICHLNNSTSERSTWQRYHLRHAGATHSERLTFTNFHGVWID